MLDIILDTLIDGLKLIPFLFVAFLIIELFEHKFSEHTKNTISKSGKFGPLFGSVLGAFPQCGFSVVATNLYVTRIVTLGTLISIYLSTSDEMIPVLLSGDVPLITVLKIVLVKVVLGFLLGFIIDFIYRPKKKKEDFHICESEDCDCEDSIIKSTIIHTLKTTCYILLVTFILNTLFEYIGEDNIKSLMVDNKILAPFVASLIGLIPNCGASVVISSLFVEEVITFGTVMAGLLTNAGISLIVLFKSNKNIKENIAITALIYSLGVLVGILFNLFL